MNLEKFMYRYWYRLIFFSIPQPCFQMLHLMLSCERLYVQCNLKARVFEKLNTTVARPFPAVSGQWRHTMPGPGYAYPASTDMGVQGYLCTRHVYSISRCV